MLPYGGAAVRATGAAAVAATVAGLGWMALIAHETAVGGETPGAAVAGDGRVLSAVGAAEGLGGPVGDAEAAVSLGQPTMPLQHANQRLAAALSDEPAVLAPLIDAAEAHHMDPRLVLAVAWHESRWDPTARSHAGAVGVMQVQPTTVRWVAREIGDPLTPAEPADNATAGVVYLGWLQDTFEDTRTALIAYNQGARALREHGAYPGAERYADAVLETRAHLERAGWTPSTAQR